MIEAVVITKRIIPRVIRRVNVNQLDLPAKLRFERMQSQQVIPFENQVFTNYAVFIAFKLFYGLLAFRRVAREIGSCFGVEQAVDFILR